MPRLSRSPPKWKRSPGSWGDDEGVKRLRKAIADEIGTHLWPDPVVAILWDVAIVLWVAFGVLLIGYQVHHGGHLPTGG